MLPWIGKGRPEIAGRIFIVVNSINRESASRSLIIDQRWFAKTRSLEIKRTGALYPALPHRRVRSKLLRLLRLNRGPNAGL